MSIYKDSAAVPAGSKEVHRAGFATGATRRRLVEVPLPSTGRGGGCGRTLSVTEIFTGDRGPHVEEDLFAERADLMIGLNAASITGLHTYLVMGEVRIDGRLIYLPERRDGSRVLHDGLLVRCEGLPEWHKENLRAWLQSKDPVKAATCVAVACKILYQIGALGMAPRRGCWLPASFFSHLAHHGIHGSDGHPVKHRFYAINRDADRLWHDLVPWRLFPGALRRAVAVGRDRPGSPRH